MNGPRWIKQWIGELAVLNEQFRDEDGSVDFEALGREEYAFRVALITGHTKKSERARLALELAEKAYRASVENGKRGGRPAKTTADAPTREGEDGRDHRGNTVTLESSTSASTSAKTLSEARQVQARESRRTGGDSARGGQCSIVPPVRSSGPMPANVQKVYDFASLEGLDENDAYECWYVTTAERDGCDADGNPVTNWKPFVRSWCNTKAEKRRARHAG